jgi:hypothetical protein
VLQANPVDPAQLRRVLFLSFRRDSVARGIAGRRGDPGEKAGLLLWEGYFQISISVV